MNKATSNQNKPFRFRTHRGQILTEQIAEIEALAEERLRAGVAYHSVQTGALVLLKMALENIEGLSLDSTNKAPPIQACTRPPKQTRCSLEG